MAIKVNYKGTSCRGTLFTYKCPVCCHEQDVSHPASEEPLVRCDKCNHCMNKKPTVPALDADHHDSMKSHNLGWDTDG